VSGVLDADEAVSDPLDHLDLDRLRRRHTAKWSQYGDDVIPAWVADSDGDICPPVRVAIDALLDRGDLTYPSDGPRRALALAFAARMDARYHWQPDPGRVMVFTDVVQAVSFAIDRLSTPGEPVMMHSPAFGPFVDEIVGLGRHAALLPFERDGGGWRAGLDQVRVSVDAGARMLILVNPHNPLGVVWKRGDLEALAELVVERDLVVVADEIYSELTHDPHVHVPFASLGPDVEARTLTLTSVAKSHNLAGLRCAVGHVGDRLDALDAVPASQIGQVSNIGFEATLAAWRDGDQWLESYRLSLTDRRDRLAAALADHLPMVDHVAPEATFLSWIDFGPLDLPEPPAQFFLDRALVALGSGEEYGPGGEGRVRLNFATSTELLDEIVERMVTSVDIWRASR
jgi:cystathionine beta-lyase